MNENIISTMLLKKVALDSSLKMNVYRYAEGTKKGLYLYIPSVSLLI